MQLRADAVTTSTVHNAPIYARSLLRQVQYGIRLPSCTSNQLLQHVRRVDNASVLPPERGADHGATTAAGCAVVASADTMSPGKRGRRGLSKHTADRNRTFSLRHGSFTHYVICTNDVYTHTHTKSMAYIEYIFRGRGGGCSIATKLTYFIAIKQILFVLFTHEIFFGGGYTIRFPLPLYTPLHTILQYIPTTYLCTICRVDVLCIM